MTGAGQGGTQAPHPEAHIEGSVIRATTAAVIFHAEGLCCGNPGGAQGRVRAEGVCTPPRAFAVGAQ